MVDKLAGIISGLALFVAATGCSERTTAGPSADAWDSWHLYADLAPEDAAGPDQAVPDVPPAPEDSKIIFTEGGAVGQYDHVLDRILVPSTTADAQKYAMVFNGKKQNALGSILAMLGSAASGLDLQQATDSSVCSGKAINLLRVSAQDLVSDPAATGQSWVGQSVACCTTASCLDPLSKTCNAAAKQNCFSGSATFSKDPSVTPGQLMSGSVAAGQFSLGPAKLVLRLGFSVGSTIDFVLVHATFQGQIYKGGIQDGILSGAIPKSDLDNKLIPAITLMLDKTYKDPATNPSTKDIIKQLFDINGDGSITLSEVQNNPLISTFLKGDVDVDSDGVKELSFGVGFSAVWALIQ